ncbi:DUF1702 family protein [Micromonospora sp. DH15]|nr:DUF1702 family protein [Micromonospora sp. DH15]
MAGTIRALRRRVLTPDVKETLVSTRGFHVKNPESRTILETVGSSFLTGLSSAAGARRVTDELIPAGPDASGLPAYEVWRRAVAARFRADARVQP